MGNIKTNGLTIKKDVGLSVRQAQFQTVSGRG